MPTAKFTRYCCGSRESESHREWCPRIAEIQARAAAVGVKSEETTYTARVRVFDDLGDTVSVAYESVLSVKETELGSLQINKSNGSVVVIAGGEWRSFVLIENK